MIIMIIIDTRLGSKYTLLILVANLSFLSFPSIHLSNMLLKFIESLNNLIGSPDGLHLATPYFLSPLYYFAVIDFFSLPLYISFII